MAGAKTKNIVSTIDAYQMLGRREPEAGGLWERHELNLRVGLRRTGQLQVPLLSRLIYKPLIPGC